MLTEQFLTMKDLMQRTGFTSAGLYLQMREGVFPRPLKLAPKVSCWRADEVQKVFDAWTQHKTNDDLRALVAQLPSQIDLPPLPPPKPKQKQAQMEGGAA